MANTTNLNLQLINASDYVSVDPLNNNYNAIDALGKCYVVDSGTNGSWRYRKWSDHTMELWMTKTYSNVAITLPWGGLYESGSMYENYPSGIFSEVPQVMINVLGTTQTSSAVAALSSVEIIGNGSASRTPAFSFIRGDSGTLNITAAFYAIGRWS